MGGRRAEPLPQDPRAGADPRGPGVRLAVRPRRVRGRAAVRPLPRHHRRGRRGGGSARRLRPGAAPPPRALTAAGSTRCSGHLRHPQVRERQVELGDVDERGAGLLRAARPQRGALVPAARHRGPALEGRGGHGASRAAVDEQARAAEPVEVLHARDRRVPVAVERRRDASRLDLHPRRAHAGAVRCLCVAVQEGDLPALDRGGAAQQLARAVAEGSDEPGAGAHRLLGLPRARDDAPARVPVHQHRQPDAPVHPLQGRHDLVPHVADACVDRADLRLDGGRACVHGPPPSLSAVAPGGATGCPPRSSPALALATGVVT